MTRRTPPRLGWLAVLALGAVTLSACSGSDDPAGEDVDVFELAVGDCVRAPEEVTTEIETVVRTDCTSPHEQEVYAEVAYDGEDEDTYPGDAALVTFADGRCAEEFEEYVGVDYRDSELFFTYLLPSARGWDQGDDRDVLCFVTTTGSELTTTVKGSAL